MLYFSVKDSLSPPPSPHLPKKAITDQSALGPDRAGCAMCVTPLQTSYFSPRYLRLLPNLNHTFFLHSSKQNQPTFGFSNTGTINDTVSHLLVVSFNLFQSPRNLDPTHSKSMPRNNGAENFSFSNISSASIIFTDILNAV